MRRTFRFGAALAAAALGVTCLVAPTTAFAEWTGITSENWNSDVPSGQVYMHLAVSGQPMYRLYNQWTGEHFYTASETERQSLAGVGWTYEGVGWIAPMAAVDSIGEQDPVYRLYNPYVEGGDHHYTMDVNEYRELQKLGWTDEGIGWYSASKNYYDRTPLYRQYNPYATSGSHNYTTSEEEGKALVKAGWKAENIAWYGYGEGFGATADASDPTDEERRALRFAKEIVADYAESDDEGSLSYLALVGELLDLDFSRTEAHYAATFCGADWNANATAAARGLIADAGKKADAKYVSDRLAFSGYTDAQISHALGAAGLA